MVIGGTSALADGAIARLQELEQRWSRFLPDSEVSVLNRNAGNPCVVSPDTALLAELACRAWHETAGRFDPTQLEALADLGYRTSWDDGATPPARLPGARHSAGCRGVEVDRDRNLVWLPAGVMFDPGGLGKGVAADLVVAECMAAGADGALVNLGGDLRVAGQPPWGDTWTIRVEHPHDPGTTIAEIDIADGGVATTSRAHRRWSLPDGGEAHHVLDPLTSLPADRRWTTATVVAPTAWQADVGAKVVFLDGSTANVPAARAALLAFADGEIDVLTDSSRCVTRAECEARS